MFRRCQTRILNFDLFFKVYPFEAENRVFELALDFYQNEFMIKFLHKSRDLGLICSLVFELLKFDLLWPIYSLVKIAKIALFRFLAKNGRKSTMSYEPLEAILRIFELRNRVQEAKLPQKCVFEGHRKNSNFDHFDRFFRNFCGW